MRTVITVKSAKYRPVWLLQFLGRLTELVVLKREHRLILKTSIGD